jgi:hypothetical protein
MRDDTRSGKPAAAPIVERGRTAGPRGTRSRTETVGRNIGVM